MHETVILYICHTRRVRMNTRAVTIVRNNIIVHLPYSRSRNQHAGRYNCAKEHYCSFAMLAGWESTLGPLQLHETVLLRSCHTRRVAKKVICALPGASLWRAARIMSPRDDISLILPHHEVPFGKKRRFSHCPALHYAAPRR